MQFSRIRLEALTHSSLSFKSLSRGNGNFVLTGLEVAVTAAGDDKPRPVKIAGAVADYSQKGFPVQLAIDGKSNSGWSVAGFLRRKDCEALFTFDEPLPAGTGTTLTIQLKHESRFARNNIGRFRLSITSADKPQLKGKNGPPAVVIAALGIDPPTRSAEQRGALSAYYRTIAPQLATVRGQLTRVKRDRNALQKSLPQTLVSKAVKPRVMRILPRGNWMDESGEVVSPAVPHFLPQIESGARLNRLDLARWLVSGNNPLTARVYVNRLWKQLFGRGLAATLDDLGSQGERPTHPRLLDYLAAEFVDSGWDSKHMVKLIVMSATYRQSSQTDENLRQRDPYNRWLARQSRHRLDAELIRDNALAISGLLSRKIGGRSVRPYQPKSYWDHANTSVGDAGRPRYVQDHGEDLYRRGLYTYWKRTFLHPALLVFDAPNRESCTVQRPRSNTPLQALVLLNDVQFVEAARSFGQRIIRSGGTEFSDRLEFAFRWALSRQPRSIDKHVLENLYRTQLSEYRRNPEAAEKLIDVGESEVPSDIDIVELATWTALARAILNLHETITRN